MNTRALALASSALVVLLFMLCLAWEWRIAPLRPGGSWLVAKGVPLIIVLPGLLAGRRYTYQATSLMVIGYFAEGIVRAASEPGASQVLAGAEATLAFALFCSCVAFARLTRARAATKVGR
jgi:uncharacterized membrane protein